METMRRFTEGSGNLICQNPGVVCGVPSTPQPARLTQLSHYATIIFMSPRGTDEK